MTLIGIIGGGQLGRMMALAGLPLGLNFRFLDPSPSCPAGQIAPCIIGDYDDPEALAKFREGLDVITYEFENIPVAALDALQNAAPISPPRSALAVSQDRLTEKSFFREIGIVTPKFAAVGNREELDAAIAEIGLPAVLKTRRFGYDGKGQEVLRNQSDVSAAWSRLDGHACILEQMIAFDEEVSVIAARSVSGEIAVYPLAHNTHREGILRVSHATPSMNSELQSQAESAIRLILEKLEYVGILALELFVENGRIIANEMAPRVHNSGHWTIEGAPSSQFENHLRAILDLPLGETRGIRPCGMVNLIGTLPEIRPLLAMPDVHVHLYGKEPRPGRKIGHVTALAESSDALNQRLVEIQTLIAAS